jgi:hypothetical protein
VLTGEEIIHGIGAVTAAGLGAAGGCTTVVLPEERARLNLILLYGGTGRAPSRSIASLAPDRPRAATAGAEISCQR